MNVPIKNEFYALALLQHYTWPENARELENVIHRAIVLTDGDTIRALDLPPGIRKNSISNTNSKLLACSFE
jgi:Nif-specific regulatory protein